MTLTAQLMYVLGALRICIKRYRVFPKHFSFVGVCLTPQLMYALGALRVLPPLQWLDALLVAAYAKLPFCGPRDLRNILWGLWRLRFRPGV